MMTTTSSPLVSGLEGLVGVVPSNGVRWTTSPTADDVCFGRAGVKHSGTMRWWDDVAEAWKEFGSFSDSVVAHIRERDHGRQYWIRHSASTSQTKEIWVEATDKDIRERTFQRFRHETRKNNAQKEQQQCGRGRTTTSKSAASAKDARGIQLRVLHERLKQKEAELNSLSAQRDRLLSTIENLQSEVESKELLLQESQRKEVILKTCIMQLLSDSNAKHELLSLQDLTSTLGCCMAPNTTCAPPQQPASRVNVTPPNLEPLSLPDRGSPCEIPPLDLSNVLTPTALEPVPIFPSSNKYSPSSSASSGEETSPMSSLEGDPFDLEPDDASGDFAQPLDENFTRLMTSFLGSMEEQQQQQANSTPCGLSSQYGFRHWHDDHDDDVVPVVSDEADAKNIRKKKDERTRTRSTTSRDGRNRMERRSRSHTKSSKSPNHRPSRNKVSRCVDEDGKAPDAARKNTDEESRAPEPSIVSDDDGSSDAEPGPNDPQGKEQAVVECDEHEHGDENAPKQNQNEEI